MDAKPAHQTPRHALACEVKFSALEFKTLDGQGAFQGCASLFHRVDLSGDVVMPGAFRETLARRGARGVKLLYQHDMNEPIGVWTNLQEDERGLCAEGRILSGVARGREVLALMQAGALDGLSIGFKTVQSRRDKQSGHRRLEKIDLWEISVVTFPLLPDARIGAMKRDPFAGRAPTEREFERWLTRDAGLTRREARAVIRDGFGGLKALRDAGQRTTIEHDTAAYVHRVAAMLAPNLSPTHL